MIEIKSEHVDRIHLLLGDIKNAPRNALYNVINRAAGTVVSQTGRLVRETYHIRSRDITGNQSVKVKKASSGSIEASVEYAGTLIPLIKFSVDPSQPKRKSVSAAVFKGGGRTRINSAYAADLGRYGVGVFERETSKRESSKQLFGPSPAHMAENADVLPKVEKAAMETIDKRVEHEISRILNGYGVR